MIQRGEITAVLKGNKKGSTSVRVWYNTEQLACGLIKRCQYNGEQKKLSLCQNVSWSAG